MTGEKKAKAMLEKHYTIRQVAEMWGFSDDFVRELFRGEEGVIVVDRPEKMHKRGYVTMRIPESVLERVHARLVAGRRPTLAVAGARPQEMQKRA